MKSSVATLAFVASFVAAQQPAGLAPCGVQCFGGVQVNLQAAPYNCAQGDVRCYCRFPEYGYGIRDCTNVVCSDPADARMAQAAGARQCGTQAGASGFTATGAEPTSMMSMGGTSAMTGGTSGSNGAIAAGGSGARLVTTEINGNPETLAISGTSTSTLMNGDASTITATMNGTPVPLIVAGGKTYTPLVGAGLATGASPFTATNTVTSNGMTLTEAVGPSTTSTIGGGAVGGMFTATNTITSGGSTFTEAVGPSTTSTIGNVDNSDNSMFSTTRTITSGGMTLTEAVGAGVTSTIGGGMGGGSTSLVTVTNTVDPNSAPMATAAMGGLAGAFGFAALLAI